MTDRALALVLLLVACSGCAARRRICAPISDLCFDGLPVKWLANAQCPRGSCGFSCLPDRWTGTTSEEP
jgi:hypothetical protein